MNKTVLHVLNTGSYSGAENVVITIIENMRKLNYKYNFIYVSLEGSICDILKEKNIKYEPISKLSRKEIERVIKKYNPDIIHAHDFTASIICAVAAKRIPVISHIHNNSPWIKKYCVNSFVYGLSCIKYKKILGVSESVFKEFVFGMMIKNKSVVVGNPIDIKKIQELADSAKENACYDIVFLGRLSDPKNPLFFIDIIKNISEEIPDIKSVMIGDGELQKEVWNRINKYNLSKNIELKGFMNNPYGILKASKVLCIPSKWEGFGLVAVEALALGKPVLASPVGGLVDILDGKSGYICSNMEEYKKIIYELLFNKKTYNIISGGAYERAKELYNISSYAKYLDHLYTNIQD